MQYHAKLTHSFIHIKSWTLFPWFWYNEVCTRRQWDVEDNFHYSWLYQLLFFFFLCWGTLIKAGMLFVSENSNLTLIRNFDFWKSSKTRIRNLFIYFFSSAWLHAKSLQSCLTLWDPMDYSPKGSSVRGILQARILEWIAIPSSKGSSQPRDQTCDSTTLPKTLPLSPPGNSYGSTVDLQKDTHLLYAYWLAWMGAYTQDTIRFPKWLSGKDATCQCTPGYFTYSSPPKFFLWFFVSF